MIESLAMAVIGLLETYILFRLDSMEKRIYAISEENKAVKMQLSFIVARLNRKATHED